jgi:hypothetical protein
MIRGNGDDRVVILEAIGLQILWFIIFNGWGRGKKEVVRGFGARCFGASRRAPQG